MSELVDSWEVAGSPPGQCGGPAETGGLDWRPARVPGTAAGAIGPDGRDFDAEDWWFRTRFSAPTLAEGERLVLELDGIATVSEVYLNDEPLLESSSMWTAHSIDVTDLVRADNQLMIACRALAPLLAVARRPRQRWRTRIVENGGLRWYRTMIFGRSPGYAPGPAAVGPWRPVRLLRRPSVWLESLTALPRVEGEDAVVVVRARVHGPAGPLQAVLEGATAWLDQGPAGIAQAELRLPGAELWWPHTHGSPRLYQLRLEHAGEPLATRRIGLRSLAFSSDIAEDGLDLSVNGVPIFVRGAVWTPADMISMAPSPEELRRVLERARDAGMNMLRVIGTGAYESPVFHDLCDELGILVWQDLMFASLDYPISDPQFRAGVEGEARALLVQLAGRPSLTVVCGNHEVEQQPAMLGLDPQLGRDELWDETLPALVRQSGADCAYVRSTPCGGTLPFHPDRGIAHYFGIGGYFRPPEDARRAGVRFAAECLPFAHVPDEVDFPVHHPRWKEGVLRDAGPAWRSAPGWDFDDERDYYFQWVFGLDPTVLRRTDHDRYLELSRAASGEVMAEVFGEWRREASSCRGALMIWLKDMLPGAGFGVLDHRGQPKVAYHYLRRALAPVAVWLTDEGTAGMDVHVANDRPEPLRAQLRVAVYQDLELPVATAQELIEVAGHETQRRGVEAILGRFIDASCAYLFGPAGHDVVMATLESTDHPDRVISQAVRFPAGRPLTREPLARLGIEGLVRPTLDGAELRLSSRALA
ncbi:MAG TPA: hypothetical protein VE983_10765, partial [Solirubrobacteraceae bacterium]|nr:hypothetical protein [Solirubrobacteraceae bacterium]